MNMIGNTAALVALAQLDAEVATTQGHVVKDLTRKNLITQINAYGRFCNRYLLEYFPWDNKQLCRFGQYLSKTFKSPEVVGNYLSGVRTCLTLMGLEIPDPQDRQMKMFITGLKRVMPHAIKQAEPVTPELLLKLSKAVNYKDIIEVISWTGILLGFYMFLHKSNLVPDTMDSFNGQEQFCRKDINLLGLDKAMMVEIRWSKTIQHKQKIL